MYTCVCMYVYFFYESVFPKKQRLANQLQLLEDVFFFDMSQRVSTLLARRISQIFSSLTATVLLTTGKSAVAQYPCLASPVHCEECEEERG